VLGDRLLQALALDRIGDASRHADVLRERHVDEMPARDADVPREARTLGPERLFLYLHQDLLTLLQDVGDIGGGLSAVRPALAR
jgi:hypothetical protein